MADVIPPWLNVMRSLNGTKEVAGPGTNPVILGMTEEISRRFPEMKTYCDQRAWDSDETPWCGVSAGYCMAMSGIRPPFEDGSDTDCFGWAKSWASDNGYTVLKTPRLGCVVVMTRSGGGGHVTFFESSSGSNYMCRGGNQSNAVTLASFPKSNVIALVWPSDEPIPAPAPIDPPVDQLPVLQRGDTGKDVSYLQTILPKEIDGIFGSTTEALVKSFQKSEGLVVDGVVGEQTWAALHDEEPLPITPPPTEVRFAATGKCSWFGGPNDKGVKPDEGLAFITKVEQAPELFLPEQPPGTTGLARRLDPATFYLACRWNYKQTPRDMLLKHKALVRVPGTGEKLMAAPADWGPNEKTGRIADLSPGLMDALDIDTDDEVEVIFPYEEETS